MRDKQEFDWIELGSEWEEVEEGGKMSCKGAAVFKRDEILNEEIVLTTPHPSFTRRYTQELKGNH